MSIVFQGLDKGSIVTPIVAQLYFVLIAGPPLTAGVRGVLADYMLG